MLEQWDSSVDGELTEKNMRAKLEAKGYRVQKYYYPAGTIFPEHSHGVDKIDAVLSGRFKLTMEGQSFVLGEGDCLEIPRGVLHGAEVLGEQTVVSLDAIKA